MTALGMDDVRLLERGARRSGGGVCLGLELRLALARERGRGTGRGRYPVLEGGYGDGDFYFHALAASAGRQATPIPGASGNWRQRGPGVSPRDIGTGRPRGDGGIDADAAERRRGVDRTSSPACSASSGATSVDIGKTGGHKAWVGWLVSLGASCAALPHDGPPVDGRRRVRGGWGDSPRRGDGEGGDERDDDDDDDDRDLALGAGEVLPLGSNANGGASAVVHADATPRNAMGKVNKKCLRKRSCVLVGSTPGRACDERRSSARRATPRMSRWNERLRPSVDKKATPSKKLFREPCYAPSPSRNPATSARGARLPLIVCYPRRTIGATTTTTCASVLRLLESSLFFLRNFSPNYGP